MKYSDFERGIIVKKTDVSSACRSGSETDTLLAFDAFRRQASSYHIPIDFGCKGVQLFRKEIGAKWLEIELSIVIPINSEHDKTVELFSRRLLEEMQKYLLDRITLDVFHGAVVMTCKQKCRKEECDDTILSFVEVITNILRRPKQEYGESVSR